MDFRTPVTAKGFNVRVSHGDGIMLLGSCFAEGIGARFAENKFDVLVNPFGVLYNPLSIASALRRIVCGEFYSENDLFRHGNLYHSFGHHSSFSGTDRKAVLEAVNSSLHGASQMLARAGFLFVTLGTAWVYELIGTGEVVSNCHKLPASDFLRRRVSCGEMTELWIGVISDVIRVNPDIKIIFTVSPVRHLRDGAHENALSKSELLLFCDGLQQYFPGRISYFPAYEIVLDELRDYRFYAEDMVHPSAQAVSYVWERFSDVAFDDGTKRFIGEWERVRQGLSHRLLTGDTEAYVAFLRRLLDRLSELGERYGFLDISSERLLIEERIKDMGDA